MRRVRIVEHETRFWRWQNVGPQCLSTIEAIYYFCHEFADARDGGYAGMDIISVRLKSPQISRVIYMYYSYYILGEADDLLFLFAMQYRKIQGVYQKSGRVFAHIDNYILPNALVAVPSTVTTVSATTDEHPDL